MSARTPHELRDRASNDLAQRQIVGGGIRTQRANDVSGDLERDGLCRLGDRHRSLEPGGLIEITI